MDVIGLRFDESPLAAAPLVRRHRLPAPSLRPGRVPARARTAALNAWEQRLRSEYEGMTLTRWFHGITLELNAPLDVQEVALAMVLHEQRHAGLCHAAAASLGGEGELAFAISRLRGGDAGRGPAVAFWETVCGPFAVSETVAFRLLAFSIRSLPPSGYRRILESILADEALHARIGFMLLSSLRAPRSRRSQAWTDAPGEDWIRGYVRRYLEASLERDVVDPEEDRCHRDPGLSASLAGLGVPSPREFARVYRNGLLRDVPARFKAIGIRI